MSYGAVLAPGATAADDVAGRLRGKRTVLLAGPLSDGRAILPLAEALRCPVVADPLSGLRSGGSSGDGIITVGDVTARVGLWDDGLRPEVAVRFGRPMTSKSIELWLAHASDVDQVVVDVEGWPVGFGSPRTVVHAATSEMVRAILTRLSPDAAAEADWRDRWTTAETKIRGAWTDLPFPSEPGVVASLQRALPDGSVLWVASSMPIRDVDAFFGTTDRSVEIASNRGANGIDGFISSSLGSAAVRRPAYALAGDLSLLYDIGALATGLRLGLDMTIVVVDNDGGGIFHFLPQAEHPAHFESHLVAPPRADLAAIVRGFGVDFIEARTAGTLDDAIARPPSGLTVVRVPTDRAANVGIHQSLWDAARRAI